ncbi:MAG: pentapeptide repeat-containing protein [Alphaproteobacteria bacterium]|nr:pentapeptide repeat-containing protein [Alphaproteobacteria bacterium]
MRPAPFLLALVLASGISGAAEAACADPPAPGVDWSRCFSPNRDLHGVDLTGAVLQQATLNNGRMDKAKLPGADARRTKFIATSLKGANFTDARLFEADFSRANLEGASFRGADLRRSRFFRANLRDADFTAANMDGADLLHADLSGALWVDGKTRCADNSVGQCHPAPSEAISGG